MVLTREVPVHIKTRGSVYHIQSSTQGSWEQFPLFYWTEKDYFYFLIEINNIHSFKLIKYTIQIQSH